MACNCGSKKKGAAPTKYVVTAPSGTILEYSTEIEAIASAKRLNGTWRVK